MRMTLPVQPPTLNQLMRGKLRQRMSLSGRWNAIVACCWHGTPALGKRRVTITIILGPRQRGADPDAFFKAVGDALTRCGALVDDRKEYVEWGPVMYERGKERGCVIDLEDMDPIPQRIVKAPPGVGKVSRADIRRAVKSVVSKRGER